MHAPRTVRSLAATVVAGGGEVSMPAPRTVRSLAATVVACVAGLVLLAGGLAGCHLTGPATYPVQVVLARAPGLFPGNAVQMLGVPVGSVARVQNEGATVVATLAVDAGQALPATVHASLVSPQLLGEPSIELYPPYAGGPRLVSGGTIPESRTSVPVSVGELLKDLQRYLGAVKPASVHALVTNLAQDLSGQGAALNGLIEHAAGLLKVLAGKGDELGQLNGSLAEITGTLDSRTGTIVSLVQNYDTVSNVVKAEQVRLGQAVTKLANMSTQLAALLSPNVQPLKEDINTLTTAGRTLDRNVSTLDVILASSERLFAAANRAYDPIHNWLPLNNQSPQGLTSAVLEGLIRDRLAGICRRLAAHHAAGMAPKEVQTLRMCGNPSSGFFDPILGIVPGVVGGLPGGTTPQGGPQAMFASGLKAIPGLGAASSSAPGGSSISSPAEATTGATSPSAPTTAGAPGTAPSTSTTSQPPVTLPNPGSVLGPLPSVLDANEANTGGAGAGGAGVSETYAGGAGAGGAGAGETYAGGMSGGITATSGASMTPAGSLAASMRRWSGWEEFWRFLGGIL